MSDTSKNLYEALFLMTQESVSAGMSSCIDHVKGLLDRAEADILTLHKWEERRLAYDIDSQKRGTYLIAYFRADGVKLNGLDRDCNLSESVLRVMVTRPDYMGDEEIATVIKEGQESLSASAALDEPAKAEVKEEVKTEAKEEVKAEATAE